MYALICELPIALVAIGAGAFAPEVALPRARTAPDADSLCGVHALHACLESLGCPVTIKDLCGRLPNAGNDVTMLDLQQAAQGLGLSCAAVRWDGRLRDCVTLECAAVLPVVSRSRQQHFIAVVGLHDDQVLIEDRPHPRTWLFERRLQEDYQWDGTALVVATHVEALRPLTDALGAQRLYSASAFVFVLAALVGGATLFLAWKPLVLQPRAKPMRERPRGST
jgi:ABC-type bacteriocin/lantibiotic exporter with double-glycine peptidase domain